MMFVPTHMTKMGDKAKITYSSKTQIHCLWENDQTSKWTRDQYKKGSIEFTPILLTCPYCHAEIQQDEKVKCPKCHWRAETISPSVFNHIQKNYYNERMYQQGDDYARCKIDKLRFYRINGIDWLETEEGKAK